MITKHCTFSIVFNSNHDTCITSRQLARGFAAYGIYIMNQIDSDASWRADQAYEIAFREYTGALGCLLRHPDLCSAPKDFADTLEVSSWIKQSIKKYYLG